MLTSLQRAGAGLTLFASLSIQLSLYAQSTTPSKMPIGQPGDKYTWLEDVAGPRSMAWVKNENAKTDSVLKADPRYRHNYDSALAVAQDPRRLPFPELLGDEVYNLWRDEKNPRGLLRRTTLVSYGSPDPQWHTVIDYDALGKAEGVGWVPRGTSCLYPNDRYCMVSLSAGGEDAVTEREFDLQSGQFVAEGFVLPHSKQDAAWVDKDTLLVSRDWGSGTMTHSGYAFVVKEGSAGRRSTPPERSFAARPPTNWEPIQRCSTTRRGTPRCCCGAA